MRKENVKIGDAYVAKVSGRLVTVRVIGAHPLGGYRAINEETGREIRCKSAARLRRPAT